MHKIICLYWIDCMSDTLIDMQIVWYAGIYNMMGVCVGKHVCTYVQYNVNIAIHVCSRYSTLADAWVHAWIKEKASS